MHNSRIAVLNWNLVQSNHSWPVLAYCLGLLLAVAMLLLATPTAWAEVTAEGDFLPAYSTDYWNPTASDMPPLGNDPDDVAQMDVPVIIGVTGVGKLTIDSPSYTFPLVSLGDPTGDMANNEGPSVIGKEATALGEVTVTGGLGSEWKILGTLIVAEEGIGFLNLTNGARVAAEDDPINPVLALPEIVIGNLEGSEGFVTIDGFGSRLDSPMLTIANEGNAEVIVSRRGSILTRGEAFIGVEENTIAKVTLTGLGTRWLVNENTDIIIGSQLDGNLTIGSDIADGIGHSSLMINDEALVQVDGVMTINPHGRVELGGGTLRTIESSTINDSGFVTNKGVILGDGWIEGGLVNEAGGELRNAAAVANLRQQLLVTGIVDNDGLIDSIGGEMEFLARVVNGGDIVARDALMRFREGLINDGQLVLGGDTTIYGDVTSSGDIYTLSGSEAAIVGDLTLSSSIVTLAAGTAQGTLDIVGTANLADSLLQLDYSAGVSSQPGDLYQILSASEISGDFSNAGGMAIADGRFWEIDVNLNTVTVKALDLAPDPHGADFNGDGFVDGLDLLIWQANFPITSGAMPGEGDAEPDGDVDGNDFLTWQLQVGGPPPPAVAAVATVPEPATWMILVFGSLLLTGAAFRPRRMCPVRVRR